MKFTVLIGAVLMFVTFSGCALLYRDEIPRDEPEDSGWNAESAPSVATSWHPAGWFVDVAGKCQVYGRREYVSVGYPAGLKSVVWLCIPTEATQGHAVIGMLYEWGYKNGHRIGVDELSLLSSCEVSVIRDVVSESKGMLRVRLTGSQEVGVFFPELRDYVMLPVVSR